MDLHTTLITIIAFSAVLSLLGVLFNWLLSPVKKDIASLEQGLADVEQGLADVKQDIGRLEQDIGRLEQGQMKINTKLDKLFALFSEDKKQRG